MVGINVCFANDITLIEDGKGKGRSREGFLKNLSTRVNVTKGAVRKTVKDRDVESHDH